MRHSYRSIQEIRRWLAQFLSATGHAHLLKFLPQALWAVAQSRSCHLNRIAAALPSPRGSVKGAVQRLSRWLSRSSFLTAELLPLVAGAALSQCGGGPLLLLIDRTEWQHANYLCAAVPFRGRALPVAFLLLDGPKATHAEELRQLLIQVAAVLPAGRPVVVVADREFGNIPAIKVIRSFGWQFCLRFKQDTWLFDAQGRQWQARGAFPPPGGRRAWSELAVTLQRYGPLQVVIYWHQGEQEPWILVSDLPAGQLVLSYRRRMRIDEMFSDLKQRGFDLEATRLRAPQRLRQLMGLLCLTYLWLLLAAAVAVRRGWRRLVDPAKKRALSYLQIALRLVKHSDPPRLEYLAAAVARGCQL
jgi:hypothetical protein